MWRALRYEGRATPAETLGEFRYVQPRPLLPMRLES